MPNRRFLTGFNSDLHIKSNEVYKYVTFIAFLIMLLSLLVFALFFLQKIRISLFFYGNSPFGRFFMAWFIYLSCFIVMKRLNRIVKSTTARNIRLKRNFRWNEWGERHMHQQNLCYFKQKTNKFPKWNELAQNSNRKKTVTCARLTDTKL